MRVRYCFQKMHRNFRGFDPGYRTESHCSVGTGIASYWASMPNCRPTSRLIGDSNPFRGPFVVALISSLAAAGTACSEPSRSAERHPSHATGGVGGGTAGDSSAGSGGQSGGAAGDAGFGGVDSGTPIQTKTVESFGAVGDGVADDTVAIQKAFDSGENLAFGASKSYRISGVVEIDQAGDQTIVGNGASLVVSTVFNTALVVDKPSGVLTVNDLDFDGNGKVARGWYFKSSFVLNGADVRNIYSDTAAAMAYRVDVKRALSKAEFNTCVCDTVVSKGNGVIGDSKGAARCLSLYWDYDKTPVTISVDGCKMGNVWGDDGDVIDVVQLNNNYDAATKLEVLNSELFNAGRRLVKNRSSNTYWENVTFTSAEPSNPNLTGTPTAGMVVCGRLTGNHDSNRHVFYKCKFNGTALENRVIINQVDDITIASSTFNNSNFAIYKRGGGVCFQNNTVGSKFSLYDYGGDPIVYTGPIVEVGTTPAGNHLNLKGVPPAQGAFICPRSVEP